MSEPNSNINTVIVTLVSFSSTNDTRLLFLQAKDRKAASAMEGMSGDFGKPDGTLPTSQLATLDPKSFANSVTSLLSLVGKVLYDAEYRSLGSEYAREASELIRHRASEPSTVEAISSTLTRRVIDLEQFHTLCATIYEIVQELPLKTLPLFRPALVNLSQVDPVSAPEGVSLWSVTMSATDMVDFMDHPDLAWAPKGKGDFMSFRSLKERVRSADEMRPHVADLLGWLADPNWPPYTGCIEQLARFPEATVEPIRECLSKNTNDPEWLRHLVEFVQNNVPVGPMWETLRPEIEARINREATDEEERELSQAAEIWLQTLNEGIKRQRL